MYWALLALCLLIGEMPRPEVRPPLPRGDLPLLRPPPGDLGMVPGKQHLRDVEPFERPRPRVLRMLEKPVLETLFTQTLRLAEDAGHEPYARFDGQHGRDLAAGEDRVAHGDLFEPPGVEHPLVHPFEPPGQDDHTRALGPFTHPRLGQGRAP